LSYRKINAGFIKPFHRCAKPKNLVKISPVVSQVNNKKTKERNKEKHIYPPGNHAGWDKSTSYLMARQALDGIYQQTIEHF